MAGAKQIAKLCLYFLQPVCAVLLYWNNYLIRKITGSQKGIFNSNILFLFGVCCVLNPIFFLSGRFSDGGLFNIIFHVIYWVLHALFIGFTIFEQWRKYHAKR